MIPAGKMLGRRKAVRDIRVPCFSKYTRAVALPPPPATSAWYSAVPDWGMMKNDTLGDCADAGWFHARLGWTTYAQPSPFKASDDQVAALYSAEGGYNPSDPNTDQGTVLSELLPYLMNTGDGTGNKLGAYATLNLTDLDELRDAISIFGGAYIGVNLPNSAFTQPVWDIGGDTSIAGGHCIWYCGYDPQGIWLVTWGKLQRATWAWHQTYVEEGYALMDMDFVNASNQTPGGVNVAQWAGDMVALKQAS